MPFRKEIAGGNIFGVLCTVFASVVINIETENMKAQQVRLRALEPEDIVFLYRWENDPAVWTVSNTITPYSKYVLKKYIESSHLDIYTTKQQRFVIVHTETDIPIGTVDLFDFEPSDRRAGLGICCWNIVSGRSACIRCIAIFFRITRRACGCSQAKGLSGQASRKSG